MLSILDGKKERKKVGKGQEQGRIKGGREGVRRRKKKGDIEERRKISKRVFTHFTETNSEREVVIKAEYSGSTSRS